MGNVSGYELVGRALKNEGADTMFFIMGGPMLDAQDTCRKLSPPIWRIVFFAASTRAGLSLTFSIPCGV